MVLEPRENVSADRKPLGKNVWIFTVLPLFLT
jgi:hypothetical protein